MGFDLHGVKPGNKKHKAVNWDNKKSVDAYLRWQDKTSGAYFRNNCWWWRPLWNFVCEVCADIITNKEKESGHYNNGQLIDADRAKKIAIRLLHLCEQKEVEMYEKKYMERLNNLPLQTCWLCHGTGKRKDMVVKNGCNACGGTGKVEDNECSYPFSEENVLEFAKFCKDSGGFTIN